MRLLSTVVSNEQTTKFYAVYFVCLVRIKTAKVWKFDDGSKLLITLTVRVLQANIKLLFFLVYDICSLSYLRLAVVGNCLQREFKMMVVYCS